MTFQSKQNTHKEADPVRRSALKILAARAHSVAQLRDKLEQRFPEDVRVSSTLDWLAEQGWLDDESFIDEFIQQKLAKKWGPEKIHAQLAQALGYDDGIEQRLVDIDWQKRLADLVNARFESTKAPAQLAACVRFAKTRGYSDALIKKALMECCTNGMVSNSDAANHILDSSGDFHEA